MSLEDEIKRRGIRDVLHFTTHRGLVGCLSSGSLLSRKRLRTEEYLQSVLYNNSAVRPEDSVFFDRSEDWLDYINLSISDINSYFFHISERWHRDKEIWWVIAEFDASVMTHPGVFFATTNNKYAKCERLSGHVGFDALLLPAFTGKDCGRSVGGTDRIHTPLASKRRFFIPAGFRPITLNACM